jgi:hypothetical protein
MHPGLLTDLAIWGWDRPGTVYLDNLLGTAQVSSLAVNITALTQGTTISGTVNVKAEASSEVVHEGTAGN